MAKVDVPKVQTLGQRATMPSENVACTGITINPRTCAVERTFILPQWRGSLGLIDRSTFKI